MLCVAATLLALPCWSQRGGLNAEFAGGGARALAMGGAFIALADDATAVEFNPAGLRQLRRPEFAAQMIYTFDEYQVNLTGPTAMGDRSVSRQENDGYFVPSFVSYVYPTQHFVVGISEFTNIYFSRDYQDEIFDFGSGDYISEDISEDVSNYAFGLTLATQLMYRINIGTTLRYNVFQYDLSTEYAFDSDTFKDESFSANFGLQWRCHRYLSLGAVYKMPQTLKGRFNGQKIETELPDTLGFGLALHPSDNLRILLDVDHIWWSKFDSDTSDQIERENVWRYHVGGEWYLGTWKNTGFFLRGGYLYEESNALQTSDIRLKKYFPSENPIHHVSLGFGIAKQQYQLDCGVDLTKEDGIDLIASFVWYF